jgi:hypothetical protein
MVFAMAAVAALAAFSNTAQAAHTAAEVHMFFGDPSLTAPMAGDVPTYTPGSNPLAQAESGDTVWFPVFLQSLQSPDVTGQGISAWASDLYTDNGLEGHVTATGASVNGVLMGTSAAGSSDTSLLQNHNETQMPGQLDRRSLHTGMQEGVLDLANALPIGPAVHVGYMSLTVVGMLGDTIPLYLGVGGGTWAINPGAPALTVAYGWDGTEPNAVRFQNSAVDVIGTSPGHISSIEDASIRIIPEPATFGLLSLGLLVIRRRRTA